MECAEIMTQETPQIPQKTRRKLPIKRIVALVVAVAVVVGGAFGIKILFFQGETRIALTETTTYGSLSTVIEGTGTTMPADSVTYTTASTTEITGVYVSAGDTVAAGDLLYTQDDSELDEEIEGYQDELTELQNTLSDAGDQLSELNQRLADLTVTASFYGRITDVTARAGDSVGSGTKLATLVDDSKMTLTQYFSYSYEDQVYVGMKAGVSIASLMTTLDGTVTEIKKVDRVTAEGTRCFAVTVAVDNLGALTEGMTGAGYLLTGSGEKLYPAVEGTLEYYASEDITAPESGKLTAVNVDDYETYYLNQDQHISDEDYQSLLYRYNPDLENPLTVDSKDPTASYQDFIKGENRYASLMRQFPDTAEKLFEKAEEDASERLAMYKKLAGK